MVRDRFMKYKQLFKQLLLFVGFNCSQPVTSSYWTSVRNYSGDLQYCLVSLINQMHMINHFLSLAFFSQVIIIIFFCRC